MPGPIQSVQRAAGVLQVLAGAGRPLELHEIAAALDLPKPTVHGLVRTLVDVGFVRQRDEGGAYEVGEAIRDLDHAGVDPHDLRSHATGWADRLAARTMLEVLVVVPDSDGARVVLHVFRPDDSEQQLRIGEVLPFHATAVGKALLASSTNVALRVRALDLDAYTRRTMVSRAGLEAQVRSARTREHTVEDREHRPEVAAVATPLRGLGGIGVGAIGAHGPPERVLQRDGTALPEVLTEVREAAYAVARAIGTPP